MEPIITPSASETPTSPVELEGVLPIIREHIVQTPDTCSGKPRIAGTRIKVEQVVIWHERIGMSPEEILSLWPHLTLADVHAALTYYHDHRDEIERDLAEDERLFEELKAQQPSILENAKQRKADVPNDQVPQEGALRSGGRRRPSAPRDRRDDDHRGRPHRSH
jgi:uncharacterized protein (DUF433 family)